MIVAGYAHRYEPDWLIDQLHENLAWVDGWAVHDDRNHPEVWSPSKQRNTAVRDKADRMGAKWLLFTAPDERWDRNTEYMVRKAVEYNPKARFSFPLHELWTPTEYRVDGLWGMKRRVRLTRLDGVGLNRPAYQVNAPIYHLKMIEEANRSERVRVHQAHNTWDNKSRGFAYLNDERGLTLAPIPGSYHPPYKPYVFKVDK